ADPIKGYIFGEEKDQARTQHLVDILTQHQIEVYQLGRAHKADGLYFEREVAYVVPTDQTQYKLIKAVFEKRTTFEDSLFYDISAWTLPLAFNVSYAELESDQYSATLLGERVAEKQMKEGQVIGDKAVAYVMHWDEYYAPAALYELLDNELFVKVAQRPFIGETSNGTYEFDYGTIQVPLQNQPIKGEALRDLIAAVAKKYGVDFYALNTGYTSEGIDMGSRNFSALELPKVMLVVGSGVSSYEAGEVWHVLDQRYNIPLSKVSTEDVARADLSRYTTIVMVDGNYSRLSKSAVTKIKDWVRNGGTLVLQRGAIRWGVGQRLSSAKFKSASHPKAEQRPYWKQRDDSGAKVIGGAIAEVAVDNSHPMAYGYRNSYIPIFQRGTLFMEPASNAYATPFRFTKEPLLSGYISNANQTALSEAAAVMVNRLGSGQVVNLANNPNFRAFWFGTNKVLANAIFFGDVIGGGTMEGAPGEE
ncbi:MAG: zinc carboxypeptidase, partial [Bacteroidota bacterium]